MKNKGFELNFEWHSLKRDLIRNIWVYILAGIIGTFGTYVAYHINYVPEFRTKAMVCVNIREGNNSSYNNLYSAKNMAEVYAEVFTQPTVKKAAAEKLGNSSFKGSISAEVIGDTNFISITVKSPNRETSYYQIKAVLEVLPEISDSVYSNSVLTVLKNPEFVTFSSNAVSRSTMVAIGILTAICSVIITVVISLYRATVKNEQGFKEMIDAKLLGTVSHEKKRLSLLSRLKKKNTGLLICNTIRVGLTFAESFRKISMRLEYLNNANNDKVFAFTSYAENEGKTTTVSNVAIALAERGKKVLLLDYDFKRPALYKLFDMSKETISEKNTLNDLKSERVDIENFNFHRFRKLNLFLGISVPSEKGSAKKHGEEELKKIIDVFRDRVDFILIDTAPMSVDSYLTDVMSNCDKTVLVVRTDCVFADVINDAISTIDAVGGNLAGCILNNIYPEFSMFGQTGYDESGYYGKGYGKYRRYGYGKYSYGKYGKYGKYGGYGKYGKYSYGKYGRYGYYSSNSIASGSFETDEADLVDLFDKKTTDDNRSK